MLMVAVAGGDALLGCRFGQEPCRDFIFWKARPVAGKSHDGVASLNTD